MGSVSHSQLKTKGKKNAHCIAATLALPASPAALRSAEGPDPSPSPPPAWASLPHFGMRLLPTELPGSVPGWPATRRVSEVTTRSRETRSLCESGLPATGPSSWALASFHISEGKGNFLNSPPSVLSDQPQRGHRSWVAHQSWKRRHC